MKQLISCTDKTLVNAAECPGDSLTYPDSETVTSIAILPRTIALCYLKS